MMTHEHHDYGFSFSSRNINFSLKRGSLESIFLYNNYVKCIADLHASIVLIDIQEWDPSCRLKDMESLGVQVGVICKVKIVFM